MAGVKGWGWDLGCCGKSGNGARRLYQSKEILKDDSFRVRWDQPNLSLLACASGSC